MMKVSSLAGAAAATRNAMLQMLTQTASGAATMTATGTGSAVARPVAMAPPPPRSSSFGGADPRAMFEALVQKFDSDGDGKLSLGEVNALNQGGLLARNFARIDSNVDGTLSGDEIAARAPWGSGMLPSGEQGGGQKGADVTPLFDKLTDHLNSNRDAAITAERLGDAQRSPAPGFDLTNGDDGAGLAQTLTRLGAATTANGQLPTDPSTMMEAMVMALSTLSPDDADAPRADAALQAYTLR